MKLGAEPRKIALLAVLTAVAGWSVYTNLLSGPDLPRQRPPRAEQTSREPARERTPRRQAPQPPRSGGFRPSLQQGRSEQDLDPRTTDPTLRTDLLAKVRSVEFTGVERNLFQFGREKKEVQGPSEAELRAAQERLRQARQRSKPKPKPEPRNTAPRIDLKYYGFATRPGDPHKRAFLLDGEEVLIGGVGDVFKKRYRVVRIGVNSIVLEDVQSRVQQTLPLQEG